eukprot:scaffold2853_cov108-Skeletonema_marinoi.AAC.2
MEVVPPTTTVVAFIGAMHQLPVMERLGVHWVLVLVQDTHHHDDDDETTCVRAQVWDINVPQSAIINNQGNNSNNISNNSNSPEDTLSSSNSVNSTFSITSSPTATNTPQKQQHNNADNNLANLAPLLPLLKRINGIIITCQCPSPTSTTIPLPSSNTSHASYHSQPSSNKSNTNNGEWAELDLLEVQIANWVRFIKSHVALNGGGSGSSYNNGSGTPNSNNGSSSNNSSSNNPYKVFVILTFADLAITEYSPKEWMRVSVKMEEICAKFGIYSWRMGTCVCSGDCDVAENYNCDSSSVGNDGGGDRDHDGVGAENNNNFIVKQQQQRQQQKRQYGLLQRIAQQQQQLMEEMEDSVEALFIDTILVHLDGTCRLNDDVS